MIGGSYLAASPQISYRRLLEALSKENLAIHSWGYLPGFDHQAQANEAWKNLRVCRELLHNRVGSIPKSIRLGHSLGCKLHLLAPDGGRNSKGLITLSFNNYPANRSIPMLKQIGPKLGFETEFSPSPNVTLQLISRRYIQPKNLLIRFNNDKLDQTQILERCLHERDDDNSKILQLPGDHLTPASAGIRQNIIGEWADDLSKAKHLELLIKTISNWSSDEYSPPKLI